MWVQSISPDGKKVLVSASDAPARWQRGEFTGSASLNLFTISLEDGLISNLTDMNTMNLNASWSPDSQWIVYAETRGKISNIVRVHFDGSNSTRLTTDGVSFAPKWSPANDWIAFYRRGSRDTSNINIMEEDGSNPKQLTTGNGEDGWMDNLAWSPDGAYLAYSQAVFDPNHSAWPVSGGMYLKQVATGKVIQVDDRLSKLPTWSPDGTKLAYSTGDYCVPCENGLIVMELASQAKTTLVEYKDQSIENIGWSPDGRMIHYTIWRVEGQDSIYSVRVVDANSAKEIEIWDKYRFFFWLPKTVERKATVADCPAGASKLTAGEQAVLSPDRLTNPLRAFPGRNAYQLAEIQQGTILTLLTRACAPERIYWWVQLPDGTQGWTAEGDGSASWLVSYRGQPLAATPTPAATTGASTCTNDAKFVDDVTIPDYSKITAGNTFTKTWRIKNTGTCTWNPQYTWQLIGGDAFGAPASVSINKEVSPGNELDISVEFTAPSTAGNYTNNWQLHDPSGVPFGTKPFLIFVVP
jgi:Tol biopolymer transport system component